MMSSNPKPTNMAIIPHFSSTIQREGIFIRLVFEIASFIMLFTESFIPSLIKHSFTTLIPAEMRKGISEGEKIVIISDKNQFIMKISRKSLM